MTCVCRIPSLPIPSLVIPLPIPSLPPLPSLPALPKLPACPC